jgi:sulfide:quinone oxidoreductase
MGGGAAGAAVADALKQALDRLDVALIEPSSHHYDQAAWMRVGTEGLAKEQTRRPEAAALPAGVTWIRDRVTNMNPSDQIVTTADGKRIGYDHLVVAVGVNALWDRIRGLEEGLGKSGLCSIYDYEQAERTWEMIRTFQGGRAIFTAPSSPFKGGGAPLDVLHRADAIWRETGVRGESELFFITAASEDFAGREYVERVERDAQEKDVSVYFGHELIEVRPAHKEAVFALTKGEPRSRDVLSYDLLHVVPPMRPSKVIETSDLAYQRGPMRGYLDVDPETFRHKRHRNVFGIGDAAGLRVVKTGAQAREQALALTRILRQDLASEE